MRGDMKFAWLALAGALLCLASCRQGWEPAAWFLHEPVESRAARALASPLLDREIVAEPPFDVVFISDLHSLDSGWGGQEPFLAWLDARARKPVLVTATGDLTDSGSVAQYAHVAALASALADRGLAFAPTPGNHEFYRFEGWEAWKAALRLGGEPYPAFGTVAIGPGPALAAGRAAFRVVLADSADGILGGTQWEWLRGAATAASGDPWAFATHMALFIPGEPSSIYRLDGPEERLALASLLSASSCPLYVAGHEHKAESMRAGGMDHVLVGTSGSGRSERELLLATVGADGTLSWAFESY